MRRRGRGRISDLSARPRNSSANQPVTYAATAASDLGLAQSIARHAVSCSIRLDCYAKCLYTVVYIDEAG